MLDTFAATPPAALAEMAMDPPDPLPYLSGHALVGQLAPSTIDRLVAAAARSSQLVMVQLRHTDGALGRAHADSGAQPQLPGTMATFALGVVPDRETMAAVSTSLDAVDRILDRHKLGRYASFVEKPADAHEFYDPATGLAFAGSRPTMTRATSSRATIMSRPRRAEVGAGRHAGFPAERGHERARSSHSQLVTRRWRPAPVPPVVAAPPADAALFASG